MLVESMHSPRVVLSLLHVETITSKALGIIMGLDLKILRRKGHLRICNVQLPRV